MSDELEDLTREELVVALRKERAALRGERARSSDLQTKLQQEQRARQEEKLASGKLQRALDLLIEQRVYDCWLAERQGCSSNLRLAVCTAAGPSTAMM